jgi:hypothetical protein
VPEILSVHGPPRQTSHEAGADERRNGEQTRDDGQKFYAAAAHGKAQGGSPAKATIPKRTASAKTADPIAAQIDRNRVRPSPTSMAFEPSPEASVLVVRQCLRETSPPAMPARSDKTVAPNVVILIAPASDGARTGSEAG